MNKNTSYIAAAVLAIIGMAGMAGWAAFETDGVTKAAQAGPPEAGVSETEASLPAPVPPVALIEVPVAATQPDVEPIGGVVPAVRSSRTPITPSARPANREPRNRVEPVEPANRVEPAKPAEPAEPAERRTEPREPRERVEPAADPVIPRFRELVVPANAVLGVRLSTSLSSDTAEVEDLVEGTVTRDVIAQGHVAIPAGTKVLGSVNEVTRGGKFKERARLGVRFHTLVLADGTRENVRLDSIVREGESPARETAAKIGGGAVGGAIIGGIMGGRKGALLGGVAGAGAGTAATAAGDRSVATFAAGSPVSVRLAAPVTIEREQ